MFKRHNLWSQVLRAPDGEGGTGGTGGEGGTGGTPWTAALPEAIRGHDAFKDVKDIGDLGTRYVSAVTPKPFAETLPKDIAADAAFKDIKDLDGLAKGYLHAQKLVGIPKDQLLRVPVTDKDEDWAPVYDRLGRPKTAAEYKLTLPQGATLNEEVAKPVFESAHKLGLNQKQLDGMYMTMRTIGEQQTAAAKTKADADLATASAALKTEWGQAFDQNLSTGMAAIKHLDTTLNLNGQLAKDLEATGLGNHPALAKVFAHLGKSLREDGLMGKAGADTLASPVEAKQQIASLQADPEFMKAYTNRGHVNHKAAMERMTALYAQAAPQQQAAA